MKAILVYCNDLWEPVVSFELDCFETVVGRVPTEVASLPEVVEKKSKREPFQVRRGDTLFVGIPSLFMARSHFAIRRGAGASSETAFLIRDLQSLSGFTVNGVRNAGGAEMPLEAGDRIHCGPKFVFNVVAGDSEVQDI